MTIQTTSTKCQYSPVISTVRACPGPSFPCSARTHSVSSHRTPTVTCAPCVPVSTKNVQPNRLVWRVSPLCTNRSEEHTSELQSRLHLVCRLLLEKKKNKTRQYIEATSITL